MSDSNKSAFIAGVKAGMREQHIRDFPDVGFTFDKTPEQLWEEHTSPPPTRTHRTNNSSKRVRFRSIDARPIPSTELGE